MIPRDTFWDRARLVVTGMTVAVAVAAIVLALSFRPLAAYFPIASAGMVVLFAGIQFFIDIRNYRAKRPLILQTTETASPLHGLGAAGMLSSLRYIAWFFGYLVLLALTGALVSSFVFIVAFIRREAGWTWARSLTAGFLVGIVCAVMIRGLGLDAPPSVLDLGYGWL